MGAGVVGLGLGVGFGVSAKSLHEQALKGTADVAGLQQAQAMQWAVGANISYAVGGALMVGGLLWLLVDALSS